MYKQTASTLFNPFKTCLTLSMLLTLVFSCITQLQWLSQCSGSYTQTIIFTKRKQAQESPAGLGSAAGGKSGGLETNFFSLLLCAHNSTTTLLITTQKPFYNGFTLYPSLFPRTLVKESPCSCKTRAQSGFCHRNHSAEMDLFSVLSMSPLRLCFVFLQIP